MKLIGDKPGKRRGLYDPYLIRRLNTPDNIGSSKETEKPGRIITPASSDLEGLDKCIILEGRTHGNYSYPDLLIDIERTHLNEDWNEAHNSLRQENSYMLTIRQFVDFLNLLKSGNVYNEAGNKIDSQRVSKILNDIIEIRYPSRAEHLDAKFGNNTITYHKIDSNGNLEEVREPLEECLMSDKTPGIDLDSWLKSATNQGLPKRNTPNGNLNYRYSRKDGVAKDGVARFDANSVWAYLSCVRNPGYSYSWLGVRAARLKK